MRDLDCDRGLTARPAPYHLFEMADSTEDLTGARGPGPGADVRPASRTRTEPPVGLPPADRPFTPAATHALHGRRDLSAGDEIVGRCEEAGVEQVDLQYSDLSGRARTVSVPARRLAAVLKEGEMVDRAAIDDGATEVESELLLRPDAGTFTLVSRPGQPTSARIVCNAYTADGLAHGADPRGALARVLAVASVANFEYLVSVEIEFFLFPTGAAAQAQPGEDRGGHVDLDPGVARQAEADILTGLEAMGIPIESGHHELPSGQLHLNLPMQPAMAAADAIASLKPAVNEIAARRGLAARFMPKPRNDAPGCAMPVQQVLRRVFADDTLRPGIRGTSAADAANNAFHDQGADGLSDQGRWFIAGQLHHAAGLCALVAPLVNSYKRLLAPGDALVAGWGRRSRAVLLRVTSAQGGLGTRLELRLPDPSCNPYLAFAAMLAAGLDGIAEEQEPEPAVDAQSRPDLTVRRPLPAALGEALVFLRHDEVLSQAVGEEVLRLFTQAKEMEWAEYSRQVTQWELDTYLRSY